MKKLLATLAALAGLCLHAGAAAEPLDDAELAEISGSDGVNFAMHFALNDPSLPGASSDSRIAIGFNEDGKTTYLVIHNPSGIIDMMAMGLSVEKKPDGSDYVAISLPGHLRYTNWGFESLSAQTDPLAPVTESLGRFNVNGTLSMQGQLRFWAH